ncbi:MAG TPA: hypothetical protein PKD78_02210, partial [Saprospiraceae bacterium]|nr:hypothetical protein [Saprospiraceae bacterium]
DDLECALRGERGRCGAGFRRRSHALGCGHGSERVPVVVVVGASFRECALGGHGRVDGAERPEHLCGPVQQHFLAFGDLHPGGRGGHLHPALDDLECALRGERGRCGAGFQQ